MIDLIVITGVSGAGKTTCLQALEEAGYYIVDNIPSDVAEKLFETFKSKPARYSKVALSINLGSAKKVYEIARKDREFDTEFVGLDCSKEVLSERYRLSRRSHPLQNKGYTLEQSLIKDYEDIRSLRDLFSFYVDTSKITTADLSRYIYENLIREKADDFVVTFVSFGYKKTVPQDIETVFDVRILPNPYWVSELKDLTGKDEKVRDFVLGSEITKDFLNHVTKYLTYYLEKLKQKGRRRAFIGVACSGGQHRSVVVAEYLAKYFSNDYATAVNHRDMPR